MKVLILFILLFVYSLNAGWMNVDSINIKQKWRNKKLNTDALLYIKDADSLLDTCNIYYKSGLIGINTNSPSVELTVAGTGYISNGLQVENYTTLDTLDLLHIAYIGDSLILGDGIYRLKLNFQKGAPITSTQYSMISTVIDAFTGLNGGSLILQPASNVADKSIAFLGGTTGKITAEIFDTTLFRTFTDSNFISGITTIDDITHIQDTLFVNGKFRATDNMGLSNAESSPTQEWYWYLDETGMGLKDNINSVYPIYMHDNCGNNLLVFRNNFVGIGESNPDGKLHLRTASAGTITPSSSADDMIIENDANSGITILSPDANYSSIFFGSPSHSAGGAISWKYDDSNMLISTTTDASIVFRYDDNVEAMRIDGDGDVGIGTVPSGSYQLEVNSGTSDPVVLFESTDANAKIILKDLASTQYLVTQNSLLSLGPNSSYIGFDGNLNINASGHVGIGESSPTCKLDISSEEGDNALIINDIDDSDNLRIRNRIDSDGDAVIELYDKDETQTVKMNSNGSSYITGGQFSIGVTTTIGVLHISGAPETYSDVNGQLVIADSSSLAEGNGGGIMFNGNDGVTPNRTYAGIQAYKANATSGNYDAQLHFQTRKNGSTATTKMIIDQDGNLGIGTTTPDAKLTIAEGTDTIKIEAEQWGSTAMTVGNFLGGVSDPDMVQVGSSGFYQPAFAGAATVEEVHGTIKVPTEAKEDDTLWVNVKWAPSTTGSGNVRWHFYYAILSNPSTTVTAPDDSVMATDAAGGTIGEFKKLEMGYITGAGPKTAVMFRFFRDPGDAADTYGADAFVIGLSLKYRIGSLGVIE